MLAPGEELQQYRDAILPSLPPELQKLQTEQDNEVYSRDLGSQIPLDPEYEFINGEYVKVSDDESDDEYESEGAGESEIMSNSTIQYTGQSYTTQDAIAVQLNGINSGR
jgi:hypothetical protein